MSVKNLQVGLEENDIGVFATAHMLFARAMRRSFQDSLPPVDAQSIRKIISEE